MIFVSFDNFRWILLGILLEVKGKMGGQKKPLGWGYSQGANAFFNAFFNHTYCIEPTLTNSKLFHQFRAALFIFRSPLYIVNAILFKEFLYQ